MSVVSMSISKKGERRYLLLEIRMQMYDDVIELRKQRLSYTQIQRKIYEKYGKQISLSRISDWLNRKHKPLGKVNKLDDKPSTKLAYIVGTVVGDGCKCLYKKFKQYILQLTVKDKEFAEEFGKCLAKVLGKKEPYKPSWNEKLSQWVVRACSIQLFKFLNRPSEELKPYIEYSKETVASFLRALFDGEGSIYKRRLMLYNTNVELLNYVKYLLKKYFNIDSTGPHLIIENSKIMHFPNNRIGKAKKDYYYLYIRSKNLLNFYKYIGFVIKRKQKNLIEAIK